MKITTVGIDIAKSVFHVFAVNNMGTLVKKKQLKRKELLGFIAQLEPCRVAMEACGGAHHWAREFQTTAWMPEVEQCRSNCRSLSTR